MNQKLHELREKIFARLNQLCQETEPQQSETLLMQDDHFYGHRFQLGQVKAILTNEDSRVKFYNTTGRIMSDLAISELNDLPSVDISRAA